MMRAGRLTALTNARGYTTDFDHDARGRLIGETDPLGHTTTFAYEDGNRIQKETPSEVIYYSWDEDSRLVSAEPVAGPVTLTYRADGRRVRKETPSETKKFIYDFKRLLQETDDTGTVEQEYTSTLSEWGKLVSEYDGTDTLYHQYDAIGSTDALLDDTETATDRYAHRAFGIEESHRAIPDTIHNSQCRTLEIGKGVPRISPAPSFRFNIRLLSRSIEGILKSPLRGAKLAKADGKCASTGDGKRCQLLCPHCPSRANSFRFGRGNWLSST